MSEATTKRLRQGLLALTAGFRPVDEAAVRKVLDERLIVLFHRMTRSEQQHAVRVMKRLQAAGHDEPDLLVAALLHDVGKSRYGLNLFERTAVVLVGKLLPRRAGEWSTGQPRGWRRAFVIRERHPAWSAEDMAAAGASAQACWLARWHQDPPETSPGVAAERLLLALNRADALG
jgi:hypothetical protein